MAIASQDLRMARVALAAEPPLLSHAVINAQQCTEKALKALLVLAGVTVKKIHDLAELAQQTNTSHQGLNIDVSDAEWLTLLAGGHRYPGEPDEPLTLAIAAEAIALAGEVLDAALVRMPDDVQSRLRHS